VDAEIQSWDLETLLEKLSVATGWEVFVERAPARHFHQVQKLIHGRSVAPTVGEGDYARSQTNGVTRLFVSRAALGGDANGQEIRQIEGLPDSQRADRQIEERLEADD